MSFWLYDHWLVAWIRPLPNMIRLSIIFAPMSVIIGLWFMFSYYPMMIQLEETDTELDSAWRAYEDHQERALQVSDSVIFKPKPLLCLDELLEKLVIVMNHAGLMCEELVSYPHKAGQSGTTTSVDIKLVGCYQQLIDALHHLNKEYGHVLQITTCNIVQHHQRRVKAEITMKLMHTSR